jgi:hypothetical protein
MYINSEKNITQLQLNNRNHLQIHTKQVHAWLPVSAEHSAVRYDLHHVLLSYTLTLHEKFGRNGINKY